MVLSSKQLLHEYNTLIQPRLTLEEYTEIRSKYASTHMNRIVADELIRRAKLNPETETFPTAVTKPNTVWETADRDTLSNRHGCSDNW